MGYSKEIYAKALNMKLGEAKARKNEYERAISALREENKEFFDIETALTRAGSAVALAAISADTENFEKLKDFCIEKNNRKAEILREHGISKPESACKKCDDTGYFGGKLCDCVEELARSLTFESLSRSLPIGECRFDNFDLNYYSNEPDADGSVPRKRATSILNLCKNFVNEFPDGCRSLLFTGGAGLGKTHLSLAIVTELAAKGYGVIYGSAQNLFSAAEKEHFSYTGETSTLDALLNCDLLVIDDLGTEFYSAYAASLFYNIVNTRILNRKATVINTNLSFEELEKRYTARITSRFIGCYDMKKFIGNDIRQIKAFS